MKRSSSPGEVNPPERTPLGRGPGGLRRVLLARAATVEQKGRRRKPVPVGYGPAIHDVPARRAVVAGVIGGSSAGRETRLFGREMNHSLTDGDRGTNRYGREE